MIKIFECLTHLPDYPKNKRGVRWLKLFKFIFVFILLTLFSSSLSLAYETWINVGEPVAYYGHASYESTIPNYPYSNLLNVPVSCLSQEAYLQAWSDRVYRLDWWCQLKQGKSYHYPTSWGDSVAIVQPNYYISNFPTTVPYCNYPLPGSINPYGTQSSFAAYVSVYGQVQCGNKVFCNDETYFPTLGLCCNAGGTLATANDPKGRCCYQGQTLNSDSLSSDGLYVCYDGQ